ncbi:uncharacterized protein LOC114655833 [Erpetoichthys calabaricus]|uniref:uncharacterized protein LOC114655833 n=1 Tax=Erpetoichthys calabaricus TaxID=27687 RepID=UPI00109F0626|nr:uncharacterized protein LOC114655833 [Erpetoichthys calabaricus]
MEKILFSLIISATAFLRVYGNSTTTTSTQSPKEIYSTSNLPVTSSAITHTTLKSDSQTSFSCISDTKDQSNENSWLSKVLESPTNITIGVLVIVILIQLIIIIAFGKKLCFLKNIQKKTKEPNITENFPVCTSGLPVSIPSEDAMPKHNENQISLAEPTETEIMLEEMRATEPIVNDKPVQGDHNSDGTLAEDVLLPLPPPPPEDVFPTPQDNLQNPVDETILTLNDTKEMQELILDV